MDDIHWLPLILIIIPIIILLSSFEKLMQKGRKFIQWWKKVDHQWGDIRIRWVKNLYNLFEEHWPKGWQWFEEKLLQKRLINLPNLLSFLRIAAVWPIYKCLSLQNLQGYLLASILFIFVILTDLFDGPAANAGNNCVTFWGMGLDPIADRLLVLSLIIAQNYYQPLLWQKLMWLVIGSEVLFCLMRFVSFRLKVNPTTSNYIGRIKFILQIAVVILLLIKIPLTCRLWVNLVLFASLVLLIYNIILEAKLIFKTVFSPKK